MQQSSKFYLAYSHRPQYVVGEQNIPIYVTKNKKKWLAGDSSNLVGKCNFKFIYKYLTGSIKLGLCLRPLPERQLLLLVFAGTEFKTKCWHLKIHYYVHCVSTIHTDICSCNIQDGRHWKSEIKIINLTTRKTQKSN